MHPQDAVYTGPLSALNSGALYKAILDSDTTLSDVLQRVEAKGDFSPSLIASDPNVALTRAVFGSDTGRMQRAIAAINDDTTVDPFNDRVAISYSGAGQGFVVSEEGYAKFESSSAVKVDGVSTLQIGGGKTGLSFDQAPTPLLHAALPLTSTPIGPVAGHWEDQMVYTDLGLALMTQQVWVPDPPPTAAPVGSIPAATASNSAPTDTSATATPKPPTPKAPSPQITVVPGAEGEPLIFTLGNGRRIRAGDDLDGANSRLVSFSKADNTLVVDVKTGDNLYERRTYSASGAVKTQTWQYASDQLDASTGQPVQYFNGDVYQIAGDRYVFTVGRGLVHAGTGELAASTQDIARFISANGATPSSPVIETTDTTAETASDPLLQPMAYQTVDFNGQTYEVTSRGTLDRAVPGQPGWTESRDSTGGGLIIDRQGQTMAQLLPGDRLLLTDDGRLVVSDFNGKAVDRTVDETAATAFAITATDFATDTTPSPNPNDSINTIVASTTAAQQSANALGLMNSIVGLQHWDGMNDLQRTVVHSRPHQRCIVRRGIMRWGQMHRVTFSRLTVA